MELATPKLGGNAMALYGVIVDLLEMKDPQVLDYLIISIALNHRINQ
jgi:hypothetical protein